MSATRAPLGQRLLPVAAIASAIALGVSEFMTTFEVVAPGDEVQQVLEAGDRHSYAMVVLAIFAIAMIAVHMRTGTRPPVLAAAVCGLIALMVFLIVDLPDVNSVGDLSEPDIALTVAEAEPQPGFWLELVGALGLALTTVVMATLRRD